MSRAEDKPCIGCDSQHPWSACLFNIKNNGPRMMYPLRGVTANIAASQVLNEERLKRQADRLTVLIMYLEARGYIDDFNAFAAQRVAARIGPSPDAADDDDKEGK